MKKKHHSEINWANPTVEDLAYLQTLTKEEHGELLAEASRAGAASGISKKSIDEIFEEAVKKASEAA